MEPTLSRDGARVVGQPLALAAGRWLAGSSLARLLAIWGALIVAFGISAPHFLTAGNFLNVGRAVSVTGIAAIGLTIAIVAGSIDLAFPVVISVGAITLAQLVQEGLPAGAAIAAVVAVGAAIGAMNGFLSRALRIDALLVTLAVYTVATAVLFMHTQGQSYLVSGSFFESMGRGSLWEIPAPVVVLAIVAALAWLFLRFTSIGQLGFATGDNARASELAGVAVMRVKMATLAISGGCAAMAGIVLAAGGGAASTGYGDTYLLPVLAAVVLGGTRLAGGGGSVLNTLVGVFILGTLTNGMNLLSIDAFVQMVVEGGVLLVALAVYARGRLAR